MKITGIKIRTEMKDKTWKNPFPDVESYQKREGDKKWSLELYEDEEFGIDNVDVKVNDEGSLIVEMSGEDESGMKKLMEMLEDNSTCQVMMGKEGFCGDGWILYLRPDPFHIIKGFILETL